MSKPLGRPPYRTSSLKPHDYNVSRTLEDSDRVRGNTSSRLPGKGIQSRVPMPSVLRMPRYRSVHNHFILTRSAELHSSTHDQLLRRAVLVDVIDRLLWVRGAAVPPGGSARAVQHRGGRSTLKPGA